MILEKEPAPIRTLQPETPPALERAIKKCLVKDPDARWQSAGDLASELKWIAEGGASADVQTASPGAARKRVECAGCGAAYIGTAPESDRCKEVC